MKKVILFVLALFMTSAAFSQNMFTMFKHADNFFDLMQQHKFSEAQQTFDPSFQSKVSVADLEKIWGQLDAGYGKYDSAAATGGKSDGDYYVVTVEGKFARDSQSFILVFNKTEKMVGFFLKPKIANSNYLNPAYADTTLYAQKEIYVKTPGHVLVGMLTIPKKGTNFPIVVLVHGSGPSDMDETVGPNKPFKDLAAGLAAKGIASIRYVKRTILYQAEFNHAYTVKEEVLDDAVAAVQLAATIPGIDKKQIYILGHSLGGMLAPRIAALAPELKGIILTAAPARKFTDIMLEQNKYMYDQAKDTTQAGKKHFDAVITELQRTRITEAGKMKPDSSIMGLAVSYWVDINNYDQVEAARKLNKRILIVQGGNDFQVSTTDYNLWNDALGQKSNVTLKLYPDLNHLLSSQVEKGTTAQYQTSSSVSETLINDIVAWIKEK